MLNLTGALPDLFTKEWFYVHGPGVRSGKIVSIFASGMTFDNSDIVRPPYVLYDTKAEAKKTRVGIVP